MDLATLTWLNTVLLVVSSIAILLTVATVLRESRAHGTSLRGMVEVEREIVALQRSTLELLRDIYAQRAARG